MSWQPTLLPPYELRDYQLSLVERGEASLLAGQRPLLVAGTGAGKTVVLAEGARRALARAEQVVAICHRESIHEQIIGALRRHTGGRETIANLSAGLSPRLDRRLVVGMVPTMVRRLEALRALSGCTLFVDEAHHLPSPTWQRVLEAIAPARVLGLSATPVRPDGRGLGDTGTFDVMHKGPPIAQLMAQDDLCSRYEVIVAEKTISSRGLKQRGGDYSRSDMERRVVEINGSIVADWLRYIPNRLQTICVAATVRHAYEVAEMYRAAGVAAEAVEGTMRKEQSRPIFERFKRGETTVLVACAMVDEGLDVPEAAVLQLCRPVNSIRLWKQLLGRVMRPAPGKDRFYLLDHTDSWQKAHLGPPDAEIPWELNAQRAEPTQRLRLVRDDETGRVLVAGELPPVEVEENRDRMVVLTPEQLRAAHPLRARSQLNRQCMAEIEAGRADLRRWLQVLDVLEPRTLEALAMVPGLGLPPGWAQQQLFLRLQCTTDRQRNAKARAAVAVWSG